MVVLYDDNETYDNNSPRPDSHPSLPLESRYDFSKLIDKLSETMTRVTSTAEMFNKYFNVTNSLYEWHVTQNHFPDTRGHHRNGGRVTLISAPPLFSNEIPAATPTVKGRHTSFDWNAYMQMCNDSWEMSDSIYDLYLNPNDFLDTHYDWNAGCDILLATWPHIYFVNTPNVTSYSTMAEPIRTQVHVENQPDPNHVARRPCSYQDFLDMLFVIETRFTAHYEQCKLEHKMTKEMYDWHLGKNHFTEKCHVILSKL